MTSDKQKKDIGKRKKFERIIKMKLGKRVKGKNREGNSGDNPLENDQDITFILCFGVVAMFGFRFDFFSCCVLHLVV